MVSFIILATNIFSKVLKCLHVSLLYFSAQIFFTGQVGTKGTGYIAIDNLLIREKSCGDGKLDWFLTTTFTDKPYDFNYTYMKRSTLKGDYAIDIFIPQIPGVLKCQGHMMLQIL